MYPEPVPVTSSSVKTQANLYELFAAKAKSAFTETFKIRLVGSQVAPLINVATGGICKRAKKSGDIPDGSTSAPLSTIALG